MLIPKTCSVALAAITVNLLLLSSVNASPVALAPNEILASANSDSDAGLAKRTLEINDWNCKPSSAHPNPVVLVHSTVSNAWDNWLYYRPRLALKGYCTFALNYGPLNGIPLLYGLDKMENSAQQLSVFVDKVLNATGASKVDLIGHSQGSVMPRYYLKYLGGGTKVRKLAGIASVQYGSSLWNLVPFLQKVGLYDPIKKLIDPLCLSCTQFAAGSSFLIDLNNGGDTVPGVEYLMITSKYDELVVPSTNGFLRDDNPLVHNMVLQDLCPLDFSGHANQAKE